MTGTKSDRWHFDHLHLKALDPSATANWYQHSFHAHIVTRDYVLADESKGLLLDLAGARVFISGPPPGGRLKRADCSELGFYTGGLRYGFSHVSFATTASLGSSLEQLVTFGAEVLLPVRSDKVGVERCFLQGPDAVRVELVAEESAVRAEPCYRLRFIHLRGPNPWDTVEWYANSFGAEVGEEIGLEDGSRGIPFALGEMRFLVAGPPKGTTLVRGDTSEPAFYTGGLRYGLDHFGLSYMGSLDQFVQNLASRQFEVQLPPRTNRYGVRHCFLKAPDEMRLELVESVA